MTSFQSNDPSIESQWRAIILFGKNSATYKFAFAKSLLACVDQGKTTATLAELARPFSKYIVEHLKDTDKQGNAPSSTFLEACRNYINNKLSETELLDKTEKFGFVNVVDAFQVVNGKMAPDQFYEKDFRSGKKQIVLTDNLLKLKESYQFKNFEPETEARWRLVETAWNLDINPNVLEVRHDIENSVFFIESGSMRRKNITSVRTALNGYQKGKCFYSFQDILVDNSDNNVCDVDHFLPHRNKLFHTGTNINGVWNLVLAKPEINAEKSALVPELKYLERLSRRNEFFIESKHPLSETIVNQTGRTERDRRIFLQRQYDIAKSYSIHSWRPSIELEPCF